MKEAVEGFAGPPGGGIRALSRHRKVARRASAPRRRHARVRHGTQRPIL